MISDWQAFFAAERQKEYYKELMFFVDEQYKSDVCYPPRENIFEAFRLTPPSEIKAVILGQDPYHEPNQAHGLCFSVLPQQTKLPPSLKNIYKELELEYGRMNRPNGFLRDWAQGGVLMLNTVLTVRQGAANSHKGKGWENFTDNAIKYINTLDRPIVFMLWGDPARRKKKLLTNPDFLVLESSHPSPLSAYRGFLGCNHFKMCNEYLEQKGIGGINWC